MFGLLQSLYQQHFGSREYNICILGIHETGKTALFNAIKMINQQQKASQSPEAVILHYKPTVGLNVFKYKHLKERFMIWDLGGKPNIRKIWENYYSQCHGLLYLINDTSEQSFQTLKNVLIHQQMARIPLAIIVTRQNLKAEVEDILNRRDYIKNRKFAVYSLQIQQFQFKKQTIQQVLRWINTNVKQLHEQVKQ